MKNETLDKIWNQAVLNVGGQKNTMDNLKKIIKEFARLCREDGTIKHTSSYQYVKETVNSTIDFVEWD